MNIFKGFSFIDGAECEAKLALDAVFTLVCKVPEMKG
jgi:hypothetical protein